jgi:mycothiol system anti-sigma-R factor
MSEANLNPKMNMESQQAGGQFEYGGQFEHGCGSSSAHKECQESIETLYFYLDGELTDDKREVIKAHLDKCQPCLEAFDFEDELRRIISMKCKDRVPEGLKDKVFQAIEVEMTNSLTSDQDK